MHALKKLFLIALDLLLLPFLFLAAVFARFKSRPIAIGIGPEPIINNIYHKQALEKYGIKAETFVSGVYYITDKFDVRADLLVPFCYLRSIYLFLRAIFTYEGLYFYFNGGPLGSCPFLWRLEPFLYGIANVKTMVMPYGGDIQDMTRCPNLLFRHALAQDYPQSKDRRQRITGQIDLWSQQADHVLSGCDWVDYLYCWNTLTLSHFAINTEEWKSPPPVHNSSLRILHAPNHRHIKGTAHFIRAVEELKQEGHPVELVILERVSNDRIKEEMQKADLIADQLVIGWYAMFAIEGMAMGKPVICYLRDDLLRLYESKGLVRADEIPLINANTLNIKEVIRELIQNRTRLKEYEKRSQEYVKSHHSLESIGKIFLKINHSLNIGKP